MGFSGVSQRLHCAIWCKFLCSNFSYTYFRIETVLWLFHCWFLCVTEVLTDITQIYTRSGHLVHELHLHAIMCWEIHNISFPNINVYRWDLCNAWAYFPKVYLKKLLDANEIVYQRYLWFIDFNLNQSVGNSSCSISGVFHGNNEKNRGKFCHCCSCTERNTNVTTAQVSSVFFGKNFPWLYVWYSVLYQWYERRKLISFWIELHF